MISISRQYNTAFAGSVGLNSMFSLVSNGNLKTTKVHVILLRFIFTGIHTLRLKKIRPFAVFSYKFVIFAWSNMGVKVIENSPFLQKMLKFVRYHSSRVLEPKFSVLQKIQAFKVRSFQFYLIKCQFFGSFNFEGLYF